MELSERERPEEGAFWPLSLGQKRYFLKLCFGRK